MNIILFAYACTSTFIYIAFLIWWLYKYNCTSHDISMVRKEIEQTLKTIGLASQREESINCRNNTG